MVAPIHSSASVKHKHSDYMHWAKTSSQAHFNLASSGVAAFPLRELPLDLALLEINGDNSYGYAPLQNAIARRHGVEPENVVEAAGTAMANHLAMAAILEPRDEVLVEHPAYGPILDAAQYLGADVKRFPRRAENGWRVDIDDIRQSISPATKLIVVTNLHNPTSVLTPESVMRELAELAADVGAFVLVDEVYLDAVFVDTPRTSFHVGRNVIVTNSLTKIYGVSGLRCGWILAQAELARKMRRLNDVFGSVPVHPGELLSVAAFEHLDLLRERARRLIDVDRRRLNAFLDEQHDLPTVRTEWGTTAFPRLRQGAADSFVESLKRDFETSVVPGRFFGMPDHFRIGFGVDNKMFTEGLDRIDRALATLPNDDPATARAGRP